MCLLTLNPLLLLQQWQCLPLNRSIKVHIQIQLHFPYNCRIKSISILPKPFRGNNCLHQKNSKEINESIHLDQFLELCNSYFWTVIKSKYWDFIRLVYPWLSVRTFTDICHLLIQSLRSTWNSSFFNLTSYSPLQHYFLYLTED